MSSSIHRAALIIYFIVQTTAYPNFQNCQRIQQDPRCQMPDARYVRNAQIPVPHRNMEVSNQPHGVVKPIPYQQLQNSGLIPGNSPKQLSQRDSLNPVFNTQNSVIQQNIKREILNPRPQNIPQYNQNVPQNTQNYVPRIQIDVPPNLKQQIQENSVIPTVPNLRDNPILKQNPNIMPEMQIYNNLPESQNSKRNIICDRCQNQMNCQCQPPQRLIIQDKPCFERLPQSQQFEVPRGNPFLPQASPISAFFPPNLALPPVCPNQSRSNFLRKIPIPPPCM